MFELRCIVRNCQEILHQRDNALACGAGHHFDRAKQGYWPLLQPQDRRSLNAGDSDAAVLARQNWLARGHATGLIETLKPWIESQSVNSASCLRTLDLGCGEGSFGPALFPNDADNYCGIDLSKRAIKLAARGWPSATWVLANADRILPVADASVHRITSLFGRRPVEEIARALCAGGICIVAVPGEDDLIEVREHVHQEGQRRARWETVVDEMANAGLDFIERKLWQRQVSLEPDAITDALAMTYRAVRHSEQARLRTVTAMEVTLAADIIAFRKSL